MTAAATKLKIAEIADAFEAGAELSAADRAIIVAAAQRAPSSLRDMGSRNDDVRYSKTYCNDAISERAGIIRLLS